MELLNSDITCYIVRYLDRTDRYSLSVVSKNLKSKRDIWIKNIKMFTTWNLIINRWKFIVHLSKIKSYTSDEYRIFENQYVDRYSIMYENNEDLDTEYKKDIIIKAFISRDYDYYDKNKTFNEIINGKMSGLKGNFFLQNIENLSENIKKLKNRRIKNIYQFYNLFNEEQLNIMGW